MTHMHCFSVHYDGAKTLNLITAFDLADARLLAEKLNAWLYPGRPTTGLRVARFRGNPMKHVGLSRSSIIQMTELSSIRE
jgi:hypothetical protein